MDLHKLHEMDVMLTNALQQELPKSMGKPDWKYVDLPHMSPDLFDQLISLIGEDDMLFLTLAERHWPDDTVTKRGQVLISPVGMTKLSEYSEKNKK